MYNQHAVTVALWASSRPGAYEAVYTFILSSLSHNLKNQTLEPSVNITRKADN